MTNGAVSAAERGEEIPCGPSVRGPCFEQEEREPGEGLVHFAAALRAHPADRAAQLYIGRCWNFIENGVPADWDGVTTMTTK